MSNKKMENAVVNGFDLNQYITDEDCEFPVKVSSKRSRTQRKRAAKKNKFPVGLRKEIRRDRHLDKEYAKESYNKAFNRSERKIVNLIIADMIREKNERDAALEEYQKSEDLFYSRLIACRYIDDDRFSDPLGFSDEYAC